MRAIYRREIQSYFYTPAAYVYMGVFLMLGGVFFAINNLAARSSDLLSLLWMLGYLWMLLTPVLTMRSFAGERSARTEVLFFTSPVSLWSVVVGKFLAACTVLLATVALTMMYPLLIACYGRLYPLEALCGYLGFILQGCAFIAFDLWISVRARTVVTAAVWSLGGNLLLWLSDVLADAVDVSWLGEALGFISPYMRCRPFALGQMSFANLFYFIAAIALMLFLSVSALEARRWREG